MEIVLHLTDKCNYNCDYCFNNSLSRKLGISFGERLLNLDAVEIAQCLEKIGQKNLIRITGGEPFIYCHIVELCELLSAHNIIDISTNLSSSRIFEFADRLDPQSVRKVQATFHPFNADKSLFIKKLKYLTKKGFSTRVMYVMHPSQAANYEKYRIHFQAHGYKLLSKKYRSVRGSAANMSVANKVKPQALSADAPALMIACGLALRSFD